MSDVKVNVKGERAMVRREFRKDATGSTQYEAREYVTVTRTSDGKHMSEIRPGMLACAIPSGGGDLPLATYLAKPANLTLVYVLEFVTPLQGGQPGEPWPSGSDRAEVLVLRVREAQIFMSPEWVTALSLQPDDLIMGDTPCYMSIDALLAPVPAVVGARDPTGARRFLACVARGSDTRLTKCDGILVPLDLNAQPLKAYDDVAHFLSQRHLAPSDTAIDDALLDAAAAATASLESSKKKRDFEDISDDDDIVGFVVTEVESPVVAAPVVAPVVAPVDAPVEAPVVAPVVAPVAAPVVAPVAVPAAAPAAPVSTSPLIRVLPEVVQQWAEHKAALAEAVLKYITHESADETLLHTSMAWRQFCQNFELSGELSAFVEATALAAEDETIEFMARLPLSMTHLALPLLNVVAYLALSQIVCTRRAGTAVSALEERAKKRRLERRL